jgi:hypothetical protein
VLNNVKKENMKTEPLAVEEEEDREMIKAFPRLGTLRKRTIEHLQLNKVRYKDLHRKDLVVIISGNNNSSSSCVEEEDVLSLPSSSLAKEKCVETFPHGDEHHHDHLRQRLPETVLVSNSVCGEIVKSGCNLSFFCYIF